MNEDIDVKKIMNEITKKVNHKLQNVESNSYINLPQEINKNTNTTNMIRFDNTQIHTLQYSITSHRKYIGPFIVISKKIIRKGLIWLLQPVLDKQNRINNTYNQKINELTNEILQLKMDLELLKRSEKRN